MFTSKQVPKTKKSHADENHTLLGSGNRMLFTAVVYTAWSRDGKLLSGTAVLAARAPIHVHREGIRIARRLLGGGLVVDAANLIPAQIDDRKIRKSRAHDLLVTKDSEIPPHFRSAAYAATYYRCKTANSSSIARMVGGRIHLHVLSGFWDHFASSTLHARAPLPSAEATGTTATVVSEQGTEALALRPGSPAPFPCQTPRHTAPATRPPPKKNKRGTSHDATLITG